MSYDELVEYYDKILNKDRSTYTNSNDEPTPIGCIEMMLSKVPETFWKPNMRILDPCTGNGNFLLVIWNILREQGFPDSKIFEDILVFNDLNLGRLDNVKKNFPESVVWNKDFLSKDFTTEKFDMIVANPPYARMQKDGSRASKNHSLVKDFIQKSLDILNEGGILVYIVPNSWMSISDRNKLIYTLTKYQFHWLDINGSKKWFPKIGSSFTWFVLEKTPSYKNFIVSVKYKNIEYVDTVQSEIRSYIPLFYNSIVQSILRKTIDKDNLKFKIETTSDLHKTTKKHLISTEENEEYKYKLIHTPKQTVWASRPHKFQEGYKVFLSLTDKYKIFIDDCGMTQSVAFIRCKNKSEAKQYKQVLENYLYIFINNICRYGNFNNIRILQKFPYTIEEDPYETFGISEEEQKFIEDMIQLKNM